jgi:micrococcal nuclease
MAVGIALLVAVAVAGMQPRGEGPCGVMALVTRVFDGDTFDAAGVGRVRMLGIDAPEMGGAFERPAPFATEARERLQALVLQRWVRLDCDDVQHDAYRRRLAYVFLGTGDFVNALLVREGLARVAARTPLRHWAELRRAEDEARARCRGMWGERPRPAQPAYRLPIVR